MAIIDVQRVGKSFAGRAALADVSFEILERAIVALLGPNGGGKTTLFRILATMLPPDTGSARIAGFDVQRDAARVRRNIGVVFQSPSLDRKLTAQENLKHHGHLYGLRGDELRARSLALLARLGVGDRANQRVETLSGGLARRVEIAKGMLPAPRVLLLDEPSTGLDPAARRDLWRQLDALRHDDGVTVLLTTHIMEEAEHCDRVILLDRGRVVADDSPANLRARVGGDVVTIVSPDPPRLAQRVAGVVGVMPTLVDGRLHLESADGAAIILRLAGAFADDIQSITLSRPTLEDAFLRITGHRFDAEAAA